MLQTIFIKKINYTEIFYRIQIIIIIIILPVSMDTIISHVILGSG